MIGIKREMFKRLNSIGKEDVGQNRFNRFEMILKWGDVGTGAFRPVAGAISGVVLSSAACAISASGCEWDAPN
jgi:hypothetical protein